ncbi:MAG: ImmA/IrrE family metallo-endopeptidase [Elusimicrobia bacterium]|nr:ImmA/IrrE family metallo-endopeptidase [Elusimicrobiota bacterium]
MTWRQRLLLKSQAMNIAEELSKEYIRRAGKEEFPRNTDVMMDVAATLFGLDVVFDDQGMLDSRFGDDHRIIGCLFPEGHASPWGRDKLVVVNVTPPRCCREAEPRIEAEKRRRREAGEREGILMHVCKEDTFDPRPYNKNHTIAHEIIGHYALHFRKGVGGEHFRRPTYCRNPQATRKPPLEWQADYAAGEFLMPRDKVIWILDGQQPPAVINIDDGLKKRFREYFDASQAMMELRLIYLGYKLINPVYKWADYTKQEEDRRGEVQKKLRGREQERERQERLKAAKAFADIGRKLKQGSPFDGIGDAFAGFGDPFAGLGDPFGQAFKGFDGIFSGFGGRNFRNQRRK